MRIKQALVALGLVLAMCTCFAGGSGTIYVYGLAGNAGGAGKTVVAPNGDTLSLSGDGSSGTGTIGFYPTPYLRAFATASFVSGAKVDIAASYSIEVSGPQNLLVPLSFAGSGSSGASAPGDAGGASIRVIGTGNSFYQQGFSCAVASPCTSGSFAGVVNVTAGTSATALMNAFAYAGGGSASGFIDPYFFIEPEWLAEHPGYSISVTDVGNEPPIASVPEATTWALLSAGLLCVFMRRRKV